MKQYYTDSIRKCPNCGCATNVLRAHPDVVGKKVTLPNCSPTIGLILSCSDECCEELIQKYC